MGMRDPCGFHQTANRPNVLLRRLHGELVATHFASCNPIHLMAPHDALVASTDISSQSPEISTTVAMAAFVSLYADPPTSMF